MVCDINSPLLQQLNKLDVTNMVDNAAYIKIRKQEGQDRSVNSYVTETAKDSKHIYSYLLTVEQEDQLTIYCQLPVTDKDDPRYAVLFKNLLRY